MLNKCPIHWYKKEFEYGIVGFFPTTACKFKMQIFLIFLYQEKKKDTK